MTKKTRNKGSDPLQTPSLPLPTFGTGEVARILGAEVWRVQKYLDSPMYPISPTGQLGSGRGSRRVFTDTDVYRLGIAEHLVRSGFSYKFVSAALQQIEDEELLGPISEGEELDLVYVFCGGEKNLTMHSFRRDKTMREITNVIKSPSCYLLDINRVIQEIQKRMRG